MSAAERRGVVGNFAVARVSDARARSGSARLGSFTDEEILEAMELWTDIHGEPPTMIDWDPSRARRLGQDWRAERFEDGAWPTAALVCGRFKRFNAAVQRAGLTPRRAPSRVAANLAGPAAILSALVEWTRRYGDVPTMADWDPHRARRLGPYWRIARYQQGDWPSARSVAHHFGSLSNAVLSAGLVPRERGKHHDNRLDEQADNRLRTAHVIAQSRGPGVDDFAERLRELAAARRLKDPVSMHAALIDLAASALAWAQVCGAEP
jgi:hypothetical protein